MAVDIVIVRVVVVDAVRAGGRGCVGGVGEFGPDEATCSKPESELSDMVGIVNDVRRYVDLNVLVELDGSVDTKVIIPLESKLGLITCNKSISS